LVEERFGVVRSGLEVMSVWGESEGVRRDCWEEMFVFGEGEAVGWGLVEDGVG
jgi:hypothetical protein